jgi:hypothetical protein
MNRADMTQQNPEEPVRKAAQSGDNKSRQDNANQPASAPSDAVAGMALRNFQLPINKSDIASTNRDSADIQPRQNAEDPVRKAAQSGDNKSRQDNANQPASAPSDAVAGMALRNFQLPNRASNENQQTDSGDPSGKQASNADRVKAPRQPTDASGSPGDLFAGSGKSERGSVESRSEFERKMQTQEAKTSGFSPIFDPNFSRAVGYQRQASGFSEIYDVNGKLVGTSEVSLEGQNSDLPKLKSELARRNLPEPRTDYEQDLQQGKFGRGWEPVFAQNIKDSPIGYQFTSADVTKYYDISGRLVGSSEKPLQSPALDPIDFVPTEAIGNLAVKGGTFIFKEMAQAIGRVVEKAGVKEAGEIGFKAALKSAAERAAEGAVVARTRAAAEMKLKELAIEKWSTGGSNDLIKVVSVNRGPMENVGGYITQEKFILGKSLREMELVLGLTEGELAHGAQVMRLNRLPTTGEFKLRGYTNTPGGLPYKPGDLFPPGRGAPQWQITKGVTIPSTLLRVVQPGQQY